MVCFPDFARGASSSCSGSTAFFFAGALFLGALEAPVAFVHSRNGLALAAGSTAALVEGWTGAFLTRFAGVALAAGLGVGSIEVFVDLVLDSITAPKLEDS